MTAPFTVRVARRGLDGLAQRLAARHLEAAQRGAATRAATALKVQLQAVANAPVEQSGAGGRVRLSVRDPAAVTRERGTLALPPRPWLAAALLAFQRGRRP